MRCSDLCSDSEEARDELCLPRRVPLSNLFTCSYLITCIASTRLEKALLVDRARVRKGIE